MRLGLKLESKKVVHSRTQHQVLSRCYHSIDYCYKITVVKSATKIWSDAAALVTDCTERSFIFLKKIFFFQTGCKAQWAAGTHKKKKSRMLVLVFLIYLVFGALRLNSDHWVSCTDWVTKEGGKKHKTPLTNHIVKHREKKKKQYQNAGQ